LGMTNKLLRELKWEQIEVRENSAWVEWVPGKYTTPFPEEVWRAILRYLEASGRSGERRPGGMPAEAYIFAPLADPSNPTIRGVAEEWKEEQCLNRTYPKAILEIYGRLMGIDEEKLTLPALRYTATACYLARQPSQAEMEAFLCSPSPRQTRDYLRYVKDLLKRQPASDYETKLPASVRSRKIKPFTSEEIFKHGLYSNYLDHDQMADILAEKIEGIREETEGLASLVEGAWQWYENLACDGKLQTEMGMAYSMADSRKYDIFDFEQEEKQDLSEHDAWAVEFIYEVCDAQGQERPDLKTMYAWVDLDKPPNPAKVKVLDLAIARNRLILCNLKRLAEETSNPLEYIRYLQKYGAGCSRLCKQLRKTRPEEGRLAGWVEMLLAKEMADERERLGLPRGDDTYYPPWIGTGKRKRKRKT
jgi:hypothetical protein